MDFLKNLQLDNKEEFVVWLGIGFLLLSAFVHLTFLDSKYLFGFGLGVTAIGTSLRVSRKVELSIQYGYEIQQPKTKHNLWSGLICLVGVSLCTVFGFLIIKGLLF
jgi:hypothetical protein